MMNLGDVGASVGLRPVTQQISVVVGSSRCCSVTDTKRRHVVVVFGAVLPQHLTTLTTERRQRLQERVHVTAVRGNLDQSIVQSLVSFQ